MDSIRKDFRVIHNPKYYEAQIKKLEEANKALWHEIAGIKKHVDIVRKKLATAYEALSSRLRSLVGSRKVFKTDYLDYKKYKEETVIAKLEQEGLELSKREQELMKQIQQNNKIKRRYEDDLRSAYEQTIT